MRLLLDTHVLLWWWTDDQRLSDAVKQAVLDEANEIWVSAASAWEIATKQRLGKLTGVPGASQRFGELVAADGFLHLPMSYLHCLRAGTYTHAHRDPFDRMLAAQSELEAMVLVTRDRVFESFASRTLW